MGVCAADVVSMAAGGRGCPACAVGMGVVVVDTKPIRTVVADPLRWLSLGFVSAALPDGFGRLRALKKVHLGSNKFSGEAIGCRGPVSQPCPIDSQQAPVARPSRLPAQSVCLSVGDCRCLGYVRRDWHKAST